jgi:DeoR/GlpR family transcriptional regulator of sugar metabolism
MNKKDLTIITNSLPIASELTEYTEFEVVVIGGVIRKNENSLFGPIAYRAIENLFVDIGFFGIGGIDSKSGYTNYHMGESEVSRLMVRHSQKRVMMADYTKFNNVALNKVASFEDIHVLITDEKADQETLQVIKNNYTSVIVVEIEGNEEDEYVTG